MISWLSPLSAAKLIEANYEDRSEYVIEDLTVGGVHCAILLINDPGGPDKRLLLIRGTDERADWREFNFNLWKGLPFKSAKRQGYRYCWHWGFLNHAEIVYAFAFGKQLDAVTGHSLGGASAQIIAVSRALLCLTFGAPSPLAQRDQPAEAHLVTNYCRTDDLVCKVPPSWLGFQKVGEIVWLEPKVRNFGQDHTINRYLPFFSE